MMPYLIAVWPWLAGAVVGAAVAGVLNRHQSAWHEAVVHCVGGSFMGGGIVAYLFPQPVIVTTIRWGYAHILTFWTTVPLLLGFVAARVATRRNQLTE